mmetsp:Transcript_2406/g.6055  ORF Transcript_2406/g.6055 Transcript_2406/m.6055 type:complete len:104 (+) Transcript_2406:1-312(+)
MWTRPTVPQQTAEVEVSTREEKGGSSFFSMFGFGKSAPKPTADNDDAEGEEQRASQPGDEIRPAADTLPPGWRTATAPGKDGSVRTYYYHEATKKTQWTLPVE